MICKMYSIFDVAVRVYNRPFFARASGEALRIFTDLANDPRTDICKYAASYTLFEIGEYDDSNGRVSMYDAFIALGGALKFQRADRADREVSNA